MKLGKALTRLMSDHSDRSAKRTFARADRVRVANAERIGEMKAEARASPSAARELERRVEREENRAYQDEVRQIRLKLRRDLAELHYVRSRSLAELPPHINETSSRNELIEYARRFGVVGRTAMTKPEVLEAVRQRSLELIARAEGRVQPGAFWATMTKQDLVGVAAELDIKGRSAMSKDVLPARVSPITWCRSGPASSG